METLILILLIIILLGIFFRKDLKEKFLPDPEKNYTIDDQYNSERANRQKEIDRLLSKIGENGMKDLTEKERKKLDELSKR